MEYVVIGGLALIICLYIIGILVKKKFYNEVDLLAKRRIEMMNIPVQEEMTKVKHLKMTGQTESFFEKWRNEWDEIIATKLPNVEDDLFEAEECFDKYRFKKGKAILHSIEERLNETEGQIQALIKEIEELVASAKNSEEKAEELKKAYREKRQMLLAHNHQFGKAEKQLEKMLTEVNEGFEEFDEQFEQGNYLIGMELIETIEEKLAVIDEKMELIPDLLVECQSRIPSQLDELTKGYGEMVKQGYQLDHIQIDHEVMNIKSELKKYISHLEQLETDKVEDGLKEIREKIEFLYDLLEDEVHAKHYIQENEEAIGNKVETAYKTFEELKEEIENIKLSYQISEKKLEEQLTMEKNLSALMDRYDLLKHKIESDQVAQTLLRDELQEIHTKIDEINEELKTYSEHLHALRKEELQAREKIQQLTQTVAEAIRTISTSNLPGLSEEYIDLIEEAKENIEKVKQKLEEKPLNIPEILKSLDEATTVVDTVQQSTTDLVETVALVEKVIQYGNRYRSKYPSVNEGLNEAEQFFRNFDYHRALEQAAATVDNIEPGAIKKIEELMKEDVL